MSKRTPCLYCLFTLYDNIAEDFRALKELSIAMHSYDRSRGQTLHDTKACCQSQVELMVIVYRSFQKNRNPKCG